MFDRPTVIVLGAGASAKFGFPLGEELKAQLIGGLRDILNEARTDASMFQTYSAQNDEHFFTRRFHALAGYLASPLATEFIDANLNSNTREAITEFCNDLAEQTHLTVDRFIHDNPRHNVLGKILITQQILLLMYQPFQSTLRLVDFDEEEYNRRPNWYRRFVNRLRDGASNAEALAQNQLSVVTFNYDMSLERAVGSLLPRTERHHGASLDSAVQIIHANGKPNRLPETIDDVGRFILETARNLYLIEEEARSDLREERSKAIGAIHSAERVYVMGFHFDQPNAEAIGLNNMPNKSRVFCLNYNGHAGLTQRIVNLGIPAANIMNGSADDPIHIDQALDRGFLEQ
jgi:hypothetical protein